MATTERARRRGLALALATCLGALGCAQDGSGGDDPDARRVAFDAPGVALTRAASCAQDYKTSARLGAAAEPGNASNLWSVSPYLVLLPASGEGYVTLNVDAPHFDWLLYTGSEVLVEPLDGPPVDFGGAVTQCPELDLVEYGAHHPATTSWPLRLTGEPGTRVSFYAGLSATEESDPNDAGHAGHELGDDANVPTGHGTEH